ncbi:MAG: hypothetical protein NC930_05455, partial [Candidatus Omnitrophica bacterium]|nr:hypothetical protein [Candidatus Omnitrophota bacterium]
MNESFHTNRLGTFFIRRVIAFFVIVTFLGANLILPYSDAADRVLTSSGPLRLSGSGLSSIRIPKALGEISEVFEGKSGKTVILVQDAHGVSDAQRTIRKMIDYFQKGCVLKLIALEGASAELDPQIFKSFPDKEMLMQVFETYFERGEISGTTAAAIFNDQPGRYHGIEDWSLYEQGLAYYLLASAATEESKMLEKIAKVRDRLETQKKAVYSKPLLQIDHALEDFRKNAIHLTDVLRRLALIRKPVPGTELAALLEQTLQEPERDRSIEWEVQRLAEKVRGLLKHSGRLRDQIDFNRKFQEFQTSQISPAAFAVFLKDLAEGAGQNFQLRSSSKNSAEDPDYTLQISRRLSYLVGNQKRMRDIQGSKLFRDFEAYAESVKRSLIKNSRQRDLDRFSCRLNLLEKWVRLELTRSDWKKIQSEGIQDKSEIESLNLDLRFHTGFYSVVESREGAFLKNLTALMNRLGENVSLLVTGGFHTEGLAEKFKEKGISYLVIHPRIHSIPEQIRYQEHMRGDVSWKDYYEVKNGKVDLYAAFVRAVRDRLLNTKEHQNLSGKTQNL